MKVAERAVISSGYKWRQVPRLARLPDLTRFSY